jgi:Na+-transporting NADH:ubiquinone oxidoreductase subunit NqrC
MNNSSLLTADRMTHLKIVVVSLVCATLVAGVGVVARVTDSAADGAQIAASVLKIGKPVTAATEASRTVR